MFRYPRILRFALPLLAVYLLLGSLYRIGLWLYFDSASQPLAGELVAKALTLGLRFDLRVGLFLLLPVLLLGWISWINPLACKKARVGWTALFGVAWFGLVMFYIMDGGYYAYLKERLNSGILTFLGDAAISREMVWETYPVVRITLALLAITAVLTWLTWVLFAHAAKQAAWTPAKSKMRGFVRGFSWTTGLVLLVALGIMGRFSQYPLRWSDAQFSTDPFATALPLNPVLIFFDTLDYAGQAYEIDQVKAAYPRMAQWLGVQNPNPENLSFARVIEPRADSFDQPYNVVVVYLESFSAYKTGFFGNKLNPTPHFDKLAAEGVLFDRFFTPSSGTARSIFTGLTGIPDVDTRNTSSRNPAAVNQQLIANQFRDYSKFYFLGGSTTWANIRGLLQTNLDGLRIHEEGSFSSPRNDVWGISDKNLFLEASQTLRQQEKPFFAVIQTSGNHRPYTIPAEDTAFKYQKIGVDELKQNGYFAEDEFNAFRYMDWSIGQFIETVKKEPYFKKTIFVFFGDHGITGDAGTIMPPVWTEKKLSGLHVPLLIWAPGLLQAQRISKPASEVDVMPTIAGLFKRPYLNTTLGRDLLDPDLDDSRYAFTIWHQPGPEIGLVSREHYFTMYADGSRAHLAKLESADAKKDWSAEQPQIAAEMQQRLQDIYHTVRYMAVNNKPERK
jgi:phosphoglycerol transferase MdoB-like AlkP superfamily enzyme